MSRWINHGRALGRSISVPVSSSRRSKLFPHRPIREISNQPTTPSNRQDGGSTTNSFSGRAVVLGLVALTTLVGVGFGTRAKCQRMGDKPIEQTSLNKKSTKPDDDRQQITGQKSEMDPDQPEGSEQGAFNPETGEINWDCPCLGGMAHGTCGEQFKAAFSCFVYSEQEPKGVECIDRFKEMQDCFKAHPDEYGPELVDNDEPTSENDAQNPSEGALLESPLEQSSEQRELISNPPSPDNTQIRPDGQTHSDVESTQKALRRETNSEESLKSQINIKGSTKNESEGQ